MCQDAPQDGNAAFAHGGITQRLARHISSGSAPSHATLCKREATPLTLARQRSQRLGRFLQVGVLQGREGEGQGQVLCRGKHCVTPAEATPAEVPACGVRGHPTPTL